ncbi:MAG: hypothetical protein K8L97_31300 [Anaerolineae bacterium]|nr:hypothetical protein [Anaerolineae bacterium]
MLHYPMHFVEGEILAMLEEHLASSKNGVAVVCQGERQLSAHYSDIQISRREYIPLFGIFFVYHDNKGVNHLIWRM